MCEANAFILENGKEELVLENIDELEVEGDEIRLINIFGEQQIVKAKIKGYHNPERKILLEALE